MKWVSTEFGLVTDKSLIQNLSLKLKTKVSTLLFGIAGILIILVLKIYDDKVLVFNLS